jgi:hypothetical protein
VTVERTRIQAHAAESTDPWYGGIGIGLGFTAIPAVITDAVVTTPPAAPCAP